MSPLRLWLVWAMVVGGLVVLLQQCLTNQPTGTLTKAQTRATKATIDSASRAAQGDTARANHATTTARSSYAAAHRAEAHAAQIHAQTHVHPRPLPPGADSSAAVADSLTRILAAY